MTWTSIALGGLGGLSVNSAFGGHRGHEDLFSNVFLGERCDTLSFDDNRLTPNEWREQIYAPFVHWSAHGGNLDRTTRDMALLLRNALMRGRWHFEGDPSCFCAFLVAIMVRASADLNYNIEDVSVHYEVEHLATHDMQAIFAHLVRKTFDGPLVTSWPVDEAWSRTLQSFKVFGKARYGGAAACECQEPDGILFPVLQALGQLAPSDLAVAEWPGHLEFEDPRVREIVERSCSFEAACLDVQVIAHLLCAEHFLYWQDAAKSLHKRGRAASVALVAPWCHPVLRLIGGSVEDVLYNAALGISEAATKLTSAILHRALVWRPRPARVVARTRTTPETFALDRFQPQALPKSIQRRLALYATLVETPDHYKAQNFPIDAMRLKCSADRLGVTLPFHIIYGGGLPESELTMLKRFGFIVEDYSREVDFIKSRCCDTCRLEERVDGWATMFKLFAWKAAAYDMVVHADLDVCFAGRSPARAMVDLGIDNFTFLANEAPRGTGWHSHIFALRPSLQSFEELVNFSMEKAYCSEQDRLGEIFSTEEHAREGGMTTAVPHQPLCEDFPIHPYCLEKLASRHEELGRMDCDVFWRTCVVLPTALVSSVGGF